MGRHKPRCRSHLKIQILGKRKRAPLTRRPFFPLSRKSGVHPNPVRIQMFSSATVRRPRCRFRLQSLDLSGALLESWLPAFAFRHVRSTASFRSASPFPVRQLALSQVFGSARRFAACPLLTTIPVPRFPKRLSAFRRDRTAQVRPCAQNSPSSFAFPVCF